MALLHQAETASMLNIHLDHGPNARHCFEELATQLDVELSADRSVVCVTLVFSYKDARYA